MGKNISMRHTPSMSDTRKELNELKTRYRERDDKERLKISRKLKRYVTPLEYGKRQRYLRAQAKRGNTFNNNPSRYVGLDEVMGL